MNKILVILLAVCLISVHAFVKRDAPEAANNDALEKFNKQFNDAFQGIKEQVTKSLDPEAVKKGFNEMLDSVNKAVHAFVKRDTTGQTQLDDLTKNLQQIAGQLAQDVPNKFSEAMAIAKNFVQDFLPTTEASKNK